jgi:hypothetical protein
LHIKLWGPKVARILTLGISGLPFGSARTKMSFGFGPCGEAQIILQGGRWWLTPNPGHDEFCESEFARDLS